MKKKYDTYFQYGLPVLFLFLEIIRLHYFFTAVVGLVAIGLYSIGIWHWASEFHHEHKSVREKKDRTLQLVVTGLFASFFVLAFVSYHQLIPVPFDENEAAIKRYRHALGIDENTGRTTLIELSNRELKKKSTLLYEKIRQINNYNDERIRELNNKLAKKEIDEGKLVIARNEEIARYTKEFDEKIRVDAVMVLGELRNRIPLDKRKHFIGLPDIRPADRRDSSVSLHRAMPSAMSVHFSGLLANEIEELVKLLPN